MIDIARLLEGPIGTILDKFVADKDQRDRLAHEIATLSSRQAHEALKLQVETNQVEAASKHLFVAGWRPFIGWTCGVALANNYILAPYVSAFSSTTVPTLDLGVMTPILTGMLGLAYLRTDEKKAGVAREK